MNPPVERARATSGESALALSAVALAALAPATALLVAPAPVALFLLQAGFAAIGALLARRAAGAARGDLAHAAGWILLAGPFGAAIALWVSLARRRPTLREAREAFGAWIDVLMQDTRRAKIEAARQALRDDRLRISGARDVAPLRDVLAGVDQTAKFQALAALARDYGPEFGPALRLALRDPDPAVRVLAAGVSARLQTRRAEEIEALEAALRARPGDGAARAALAAAREAFAASGLLTGERRAEQLARAAQDRKAAERAA